MNIKGRLIDLTEPKIMGILNVTPDSFFDGGRYMQEDSILRHTEKMINEGATFIDVGGYSSRPNSIDITEKEETRRVTEAITLVDKHFPETIITIDTFRHTVAKAAVEAGASIINDISGGALDADMPNLVKKLQVPYIMMHLRGTPQTMSKMTDYTDLIKDITDYFHPRIKSFETLGIKDIIIDPGFGFAKTIEQNYTLLSHLDYLRILERPILVGLSRKSMIWKTLVTSPEEALNGTTALHAIALLKGASILRVHDVKEATEVVKLMNHVH